VFAEMYRVLKPGAHFCVSDIVLVGQLPAAVQTAAEFYAGCVSGASQEADYLADITVAGFTQVQVVKRREIVVPDSIFATVLSAQEIADFRASDSGIFSITVLGSKGPKSVSDPEKVATAAPCCGPNCCS
jgi:hypothetical protein